MLMVLALALTIFSLFVRSRLSVENPGRLQIVVEDFVNGFHSLLDDFVGPKGRDYLPLIGSMFLVDLAGEPRGPGSGADGADEQPERDAWLRADGVGLLPLCRASGSRASSRT